MKAYEKIVFLLGKIGFTKVRVSLVLVTLAICAFFLAKGTTKLIGVSLAISPNFSSKVSAQNEQMEQRGFPGSENPDVKEILRRNIFDSTIGPLWPPTAPVDLESDAKPPEEIPIPGPGDPPKECEKELFLAAAAYFPNNPNRSMVALEGPTELDTQPLYRQGTKIGECVLVAIYPHVAYLKRPEGDYCSLVLYSERRREKIRRQNEKRRTAKKRKKKTRRKRRK